MSYLVLARKSRPQRFSQVVGQATVVKTLRNSLIRNRVAHAILFSGVRGVGKTTLARIMAKAMNCLHDDPAERPCDACRCCNEIREGQAIDLHEIDGASNRGIQEIRELKEKLRFLPTSFAYKVIIIDEVHMLTTEAFNALLKTLEEPPAHVFFMFATTEIHKIPVTILSRCQQYELKRVPAPVLQQHFSRLLTEEGLTIDAAALSLIVREASGSIRDGLSLLDQMISYGETHLRVDDVAEVLGLVDRDALLTLARSLLAGDRLQAFAIITRVFDRGTDLKRFVEDLLVLFRNLLFVKIDGCDQLIDLPQEDISELHQLAGQYSAETLHLKLTLLMEIAEGLRHSTQPRLLLETSVLKLLQANEVVAVSQLLGKVEQLLQGNLPESGSGQSSPSGPASPAKSGHAQATSAGSGDTRRPGPMPSTSPQLQTKASDDDRGLVAAERRPPVGAPSQPSLRQEEPPLPQEPPAEAPQTEEVQAPSPASSKADDIQNAQQTKVVSQPHQKEVRKHWPQFIDYVAERKLWMAQALQRADTIRQEGDEIHLTYHDHANCTLLRDKDNKNQLTEFVLDFFQVNLKVRFILPDLNNGDDSNGSDSPQRKRQQLANDPLVIMAAEIFNGQVGDIRIGPRSR